MATDRNNLVFNSKALAFLEVVTDICILKAFVEIYRFKINILRERDTLPKGYVIKGVKPDLEIYLHSIWDYF